MLQQEKRVASHAAPSVFSELVVLFKLRIVVLLLLSATAGVFLGGHGWPGWGPLLLTLATGALAAMGSSAWNQYLERQSDALMTRTRKRPLVTEAIVSPAWVPYVATAMIVIPVAAVLPFNSELALFLTLGALIYVLIYTIWLKPRTNINIVIGGAAGSAAVFAGGAAANAWNDPAVIILAILLFFWTPIHFWALALVYREDYARANVPMLPVTAPPRSAALWGLVHGLGAGVSGLALAALPQLGPVYALPVVIMTGLLLWQSAMLVRELSKKRAYRLFHTSNFYLFVVLLAAVVGSVTDVPWPW